MTGQTTTASNPAAASATTEAFTLNAEVTVVDPTPCAKGCDTSNGCSSTCSSACVSGA